MQTSMCRSGTTSSTSKAYGKDMGRQSSSEADQNWVCCQIGIYIQGICLGVVVPNNKQSKREKKIC